MKFIHTADWHFNANRSVPNYLSRFESTMDEIARFMKKAKIRLIVIAGDIVDSAMTHDERKFIIRKFCEWDDQGIIVVMIDGNHDRIDTERSSLDIFKVLRKQGRLKNIHTVTHEPQVLSFPNITFMCIPWFGAKTKSDLLAKLNKDIKSIREPVIAVCHEHVKGARTDKAWVSKSNKLEMPSTRHVTYWALGDIHRRQRMSPNTFYPGSPHQHNFGESLPKGIVVVDTDHPTKPKFIKLTSAYPFQTIPQTDWETLVEDQEDKELIESSFKVRVLWEEGERDELSTEANVGVVDVRPETKTLDFSCVDFALDEYVREALIKRGVLSEKEIDKAVSMTVKFMQHAERQVAGVYAE